VRRPQEGDRVAVEVRDRCLRIWAAAAMSMIHAWDPEVVVVGGGVMMNAGAVLPWIQDHVRRHAWTPWGEVAVRAAELGDRAALLGAVPLLAGGAGG
jgi:glucokinase